jgi:hypothetical protein
VKPREKDRIDEEPHGSITFPTCTRPGGFRRSGPEVGRREHGTILQNFVQTSPRFGCIPLHLTSPFPSNPLYPVPAFPACREHIHTIPVGLSTPTSSPFIPSKSRFQYTRGSWLREAAHSSWWVYPEDVPSRSWTHAADRGRWRRGWTRERSSPMKCPRSPLTLTTPLRARVGR